MKTVKHISAFHYKALFTAFSLCFLFSASAQNIARAKVDKADILVGEFIQLELVTTAPKNVKIFWPVITDTLGKNFEVLEQSEKDTSFAPNDISIKQVLKISSYDSGTFILPPLRFTFQTAADTQDIYTDSIAINVKTIPVENNAGIRDVTGPIDMPSSFMDYLPLLASIVALIIIAVITWLLIRRMIRKRRARPVFVPAPPPPPDPTEVALELLERIKVPVSEDPEEIKFYYSLLTDILREFIEKKLSFPAKEALTREILQFLKQSEHPSALAEAMHIILRRADMAKFAKGIPSLQENMESKELARLFVRHFIAQSGKEEKHVE